MGDTRLATWALRQQELLREQNRLAVVGDLGVSRPPRERLAGPVWLRGQRGDEAPPLWWHVVQISR